MRKYFLATFGCQMNKNDSERIRGILSSVGLSEASKAEDANLFVANSCSVRQSAEDRICGLVRNWNKLKELKSDAVIVVTGCMPGRDKEGKLKAKMESVDLYFPINELAMLPKRLKELRPDWFAEISENPLDDYFKISPDRESGFQAFVTVQTGCNNFCSYCVVPYARGRETNRPVKDIIEEIKKVSASGRKEIILLGQVINNYKAPDAEGFSKDNPFKSKDDFSALLWEANQIVEVERINWTAADPRYFNDFQVEALKLPKQANYLHLPAQSGDNEILKKMNRHYTGEYYFDLIKKIRVARPEIAIGTDLIVGFCGETEKQFQNTLDFYRQCDFDIAFTAMYSERSGTPAAKAFKDDVPRVEKKKRWDELQRLMEKITWRKNQKYLGKTVSVLVEKHASGICSGNSSEMKLTQFAGGQEFVGKMAKIKITQPEMWVLRGEIVK
ncbi:MAG: tRNA (N6-isopentenyl adenosine(37)-C2)-methylthiotransferase MiaB [Patescibacteria group bacterium]|nr:tRNA (N6-isopentenyl adenosine(37)-C2)-methylthiotransferase MiaB [Patescibacteria group bacterium]